jgi:replicative DNA helicase
MRRKVGSEKPEEKAPDIDIRFDTASEQVVLAECLVDEATRRGLVRRLRNKSPFLDKIHKQLWAAICELEDKGLSYDRAAVQIAAGEEVAEYAASLVDGYDSTPNLRHHVQAIEWGVKRFEAVSGPVSKLILALKSPSTDPALVKTAARDIVESVEAGKGVGRFRDGNLVAAEAIEEIERRMQGQAVYPFGIDGLDTDSDGESRMIPGMAPKRASMITAVSGSGKSTIAFRIALAQIDMGKRVAYGAWEQSPSTALEQLAVMRCGLSRNQVLLGRINQEQLGMLKAALHQLKRSVVFIDIPKREKFASNIKQVDSLLASVEESECEVFIADLLRKAFVSYAPDAEEQALAHLYNKLDGMNCHMLIVHQQRSKDIEMREDKRPTREGIKGPSAWLEICDNVIGVHRPALWKDVEDTDIEIDVLKQRYGRWPIAINFKYDPDTFALHSGKEVPYRLGDADEASVDSIFRAAKSGRGYR